MEEGLHDSHARAGTLAVDQHADYRMELWLASERALIHQDREQIIMAHSLLDNVVYAAVRLMNGINSGSMAPDTQLSWNLAFHTIARMLRDSFRADAVLYLPQENLPEFYAQIQEGYELAATEYDITLIPINGDSLQMEEEAATILTDLLVEKNVTSG